MSRFYNEAVNGRGNTVSLGGRGSAGQTHLRGWDAGVKVVPIGKKGERDRFEIYMTYGSHASGRDILIGIVHDTTDGPMFEPAYADGVSDNSPAWVQPDLSMSEDAASPAAEAADDDNGTYNNVSHP